MEDTRDQDLSKTERSPDTAHGEEYGSVRQSRRSLNSLRRRKYFLVTLGLLLIIVLVLGALAFLYTRDQHRILEGVSVSGFKVGNLSQAEAKEVVNNEVKRLVSQTIKLNVGQDALEYKLEDLGLGVNADLALQEAYDIGRKGTIIGKVLSKLSAEKGVNISLSQTLDDARLQQTLKPTLEKYNKPPTDASFQIADNSMTIVPERVGLSIDSDTLIMKIKDINIFKPVSELTVNINQKMPLITAAQLQEQKITGLLASYTTRFDPSQTARTENVKIATKALDMAVIKPGDTLSFNQIVGERTVEGGYKDAYVIVNGEFVPGLAGGICQVSSTMYNTGLLANLPVTQRSNHDLAISYAPLGQDATVAYPDLDLKFNNNTGGYLLVRTLATSNTITIELYGKVKSGQEVSIENTIISTIPAPEQHVVDRSMAHGTSFIKQQGQPGYIVKSVRNVKVNGVVVSSEPLRQSHYLALPKILVVGP